MTGQDLSKRLSFVDHFDELAAADHQANNAAVNSQPLLIDTAKTALLLIEYQNDFLHPEGALHNTIATELRRLDMVAKSEKLLKICREKRVLIVHAPITYCKAYEESANRFGVLYNVSLCDAFGHGQWGAEFYESMSPLPPPTSRLLRRRGTAPNPNPHPAARPEAVVKGKHGLDTFPGTDLDQILQAAGIESLAICGLLTNCCVESTMRSAYELGYNVFTVHDCCATSLQVTCLVW